MSPFGSNGETRINDEARMTVHALLDGAEVDRSSLPDGQ